MPATEQQPQTGASTLEQLDSSKITKLHWKIMFISGMGFFTDAYDLFIIGVVMAILKDSWKPSPTEVGLVTSTSLLAAAIGALIFGRVADMLGRKRIYGYECLVLAIGAALSALSPNIIWLILFRFILGIGIGGDYPVSATIMAEYAGKCSRGMLVSLVFAMQAAGLIFGPLIAAGLLATHMSHDIVWRILLAFGAIPALAVFHLRRNIHETPRYLLAAGKQDEFNQAAGSVLGTGKGEADKEKDKEEKETKRDVSFMEGFQKLVANPKLLRNLIGASVAWFLLDFAYYGNTVSSPLVLKAVTPHESLLNHTLVQLLIFTVAAAPGYFVAAYTMDKLGRKIIQCLGFGMMAASFFAMALVPNIEHLVIPFLVIYGVSYFFTEFGPNSTTFVYPSEIFPVESRTTGHGISAATGKIGAFIGVFLFPILMSWHGLLAAESTAAVICVLGLLVTLALLPETKGQSLEEITDAK
jgi:PHS family inorganic phosphate transporter-like MFS transporter